MEDALVDRLRRGDAAALRELYARWADRSYRFLHRLCARRDVAEDLHQETWIAVARAAPRLAPKTDFAAWLFTIARNKHLSWRRWAALDLRRFIAEDADVVAQPRVVDDLHDVERALQVISAGHREILLLVGVEGLDTAQAAQVLGLSPEATRQRLSRARAALGEALGEVPSARMVGRGKR